MKDSKQSDDVVTTTHPFEGLKDGDQRLAKAKMARKINSIIQERELTQAEASELLGITQPEVSKLTNGRLSGFTLDRLCRCLSALDMDIIISLKNHKPNNPNPPGVMVSL